MNREQAENILNAYLLIWTNPNMEDAAEALRKVILDAMASCSSSTVYPRITLPATTTPTITKPIVTCEVTV